MKRFTPFQWAAVLTLALALAPPAASAQEAGTITISGLFSMDYLYGELDLYYIAPDLLAVYANGHEHTWTLTLHGTTQSHYATEIDYVELVQDTWIDATSFDLEFFGPDAATLNSIVSDHLAGGHVWIFLRNHYSYYSDDDFAVMYVVVGGGDGELNFSTAQYYGSGTLFPTDTDGYPVVGPEPFSIEPDYTELGYSDLLSGTGGAIGSMAGLVTFKLGSGASCSTFIAPDLDHDCDVDAADMTAFIACASGPSLPVTPACQSSDFDGDNDADMTDFGILQRCYENAVPACVD